MPSADRLVSPRFVNRSEQRFPSGNASMGSQMDPYNAVDSPPNSYYRLNAHPSYADYADYPEYRSFHDGSAPSRQYYTRENAMESSGRAMYPPSSYGLGPSSGVNANVPANSAYNPNVNPSYNPNFPQNFNNSLHVPLPSATEMQNPNQMQMLMHPSSSNAALNATPNVNMNMNMNLNMNMGVNPSMNVNPNYHSYMNSGCNPSSLASPSSSSPLPPSVASSNSGLTSSQSSNLPPPPPPRSRSHQHSRQSTRSRSVQHSQPSSSSSMQSSPPPYQRVPRSSPTNQLSYQSQQHPCTGTVQPVSQSSYYPDSEYYWSPPYGGGEGGYRYEERPMNYSYQRGRVIYPPSSYSTMHPQESSQLIVKGTPLFNSVKHYVDAAVALKRTDMQAAKASLEKLCQEYPQCHIVWMELSRLEMDQGNISKCREVVLKGLEVLPRNESLLEKRVKVEERLRNVDGVIKCVEQFLAMNNSQCVKSIVEAAIVVAKLGCGYKASALFDSLIEHNLFTQGGVTLDYIRFVFKTESYDKGLRMLKETLTKLTKLGPIWFFTFSVLEQNHTINWNRGDISSRPCNEDLREHLQQALRCILDELKWKVYYIAAQAQLRSFTHIRLWTRMKKRYLRPYCKTYPEVIRSCFESLRSCIQLCLNDYKWKVWLLAGRVQALAGKRHSSIRVFAMYGSSDE